MTTAEDQNRAVAMIASLSEAVAAQVGRKIYGHQRVVKNILNAFLVGGHVLLEGPPGVAKTLLAKTFARVLGLTFKRIQFTPDLMPSDITGINVFDPKQNDFRFVRGPVFSEILLADEINRTPPKTQSALLEAMEERQLTIDGSLHSLSQLFFVIATQNPIEHEGTFPLPEAQLDRFLVKLTLGYPGAEREEEMVRTLSGAEQPADQVQPAGIPAESILAARAAIRTITLAPALSEYIIRIAEASRAHPDVLMGMSPRAALYLALASKAQAASDGRGYVIPDDVKAMLIPVLNHRLILQPQIFEGPESVLRTIDEILKRVPAPKETGLSGQMQAQH